MNAIHTTLPCYSKALPLVFLNSSQSPFFNSPQTLRPKPSSSISLNRRWRSYAAGVVTSSANSEIDMVRNKQGIYTPKQKKVVILWDLDNKPPRGPPYQAAMALGGGTELDNVVDDLVGARSEGSGGMRISVFSEGEVEQGDWEEDYEDEDYLSEDREDEDGEFMW